GRLVARRLDPHVRPLGPGVELDRIASARALHLAGKPAQKLPPFGSLAALDHVEAGHRRAGDGVGHTPRDHELRVERHEVLFVRGDQGYGFLVPVSIFEEADEHGVARGTGPGEAPRVIGLRVPGGAPWNLALSPDPEQRLAPAPRTDLQVGAGDGLAGPV